MIYTFQVTSAASLGAGNDSSHHW